jgi:hypothetical protein
MTGDNDPDIVEEFIVLNPKKYLCESQVPERYKRKTFFMPYLWSSDWKNHEVEQKFCFRYPERGEGEWVKGIAASGWEPIELELA